MKHNRIATYTVLGGLAVAGLGAGAATLANAEPTATPTPGASASATPGDQGPGRGGRHGGRGAEDTTMAKELAGKLGLDEAKVSEALKAVHTEEHAARQQQGAPQPGTRPDPAAREAEMAKKLAAKLGVDEAKVTTALTELRQAHEAEHRTTFAKTLDQAVTDGKLTRAEADAVLKAADAGVIGMGGRR